MKRLKPMRLFRFAGIAVLLLLIGDGPGVGARAAEQPPRNRPQPIRSTKWVRGEYGGIRPCWGIANGLLFGIHPGDKRGTGCRVD